MLRPVSSTPPRDGVAQGHSLTQSSPSSMPSPSPRYDCRVLTDFAIRMLNRAGMAQDKAAAVAGILVEGDLLGHGTHGLGLLAPYLKDLQGGTLAGEGEPALVAERPAAMTWDGRRLPGPWLVLKAIGAAIPRARKLGTCTVVIRRSHHIACLAAYLRPVAEQGLMLLLSTSDPDNHSVAPYGGRAGALTPNPIAAGWPTQAAPVMIDVSMSITTNGMVGRLNHEGGRLPGPWLVDNQGRPTDDPAVVNATPKGALMPIGGVEYGHKGYALGLLVEALTQGLGGHGRADPSDGWTGEVFVQVIDPAAFSGIAAFTRQTHWLAEACRAVPPMQGVDRVRLPGESGLARRDAQLREGVTLPTGVMPSLHSWSERLAVPLPDPL